MRLQAGFSGRRRLRHRLHVAVRPRGRAGGRRRSTRRSSARTRGAARSSWAPRCGSSTAGMVVVAEGVEATAGAVPGGGGPTCSKATCARPARRRSLRGPSRRGLARPASSGGAPNRHDPQEVEMDRTQRKRSMSAAGAACRRPRRAPRSWPSPCGRPRARRGGRRLPGSGRAGPGVRPAAPDPEAGLGLDAGRPDVPGPFLTPAGSTCSAPASDAVQVMPRSAPRRTAPRGRPAPQLDGLGADRARTTIR